MGRPAAQADDLKWHGSQARRLAQRVVSAARPRRPSQMMSNVIRAGRAERGAEKSE
jgi:hypothetical protein